MKLLFGSLALSLIFAGCGGKQDKVSTDNSAMQTKEAETTKAESPSPTATPSNATKDGGPPVEFTYLGVAPDKETISYKIKVSAAEPISQVDIAIKYMDDAGKMLNKTTLAPGRTSSSPSVSQSSVARRMRVETIAIFPSLRLRAATTLSGKP